jgi:hypothetical protein
MDSYSRLLSVPFLRARVIPRRVKGRHIPLTARALQLLERLFKGKPTSLVKEDLEWKTGNAVQAVKPNCWQRRNGNGQPRLCI